MHKRVALLSFAAIVAGAVFVTPAGASVNLHQAFRSSLHSLHAPSLAGPQVRSQPAAAWTPAAQMPAALGEQGGGAAIGTKFYVIGGYDSGFTAHNNNQIYDSTANTWSAGAVIPGAPSSGWTDGAVCVNPADKTIHVVNGSDGASIFAAHQVYDTTANTWSYAAAPVLTTGDTWFGQDQGCAFINGRMFLFGGYGIISPSQPGAQLETATWVYNPSTDTWSDSGKTMAASGFLWSGYVNSTTNIYVAGGYDLNFAPQKITQAFAPSSGWRTTGNLPQGLGGPGEGFLRNHLLVWGGNNGTGMVNTTYACTATSCTSWATAPVTLPSAKGFMAWASTTTKLFNGGGFDSGFAAQKSAEHLP